MCGIVGILSANTTGAKARMDFFEQALYTDALRGWDSTGIFSVTRHDKNVDIYKRAMAASDFMGMRPYQYLAQAHTSYKCLIGHNRKATKGGINHQNAHPFDSGDVVMVHNGTLDNHRTLPDGNKFTVDSEALCHSINKIGPKETFERATGAFACVWYNQDSDTLHMLRNDERPLNYAFVNDGVLIASEKMMLLWLADRNNLTLKEVHSLVPGEMLTFHEDDLHDPEKRKITLKDIYYTKSWNNYGSQQGVKTTKKHGKQGQQKQAKNGSKTETGHSPNGIQTETEKREVIQSRRLHYHGLKLKDEIIVDSVGFVEYENNKWPNDPNGVVDALYNAAEDRCLVVEMHGIKRSEYVKDAAYKGTLAAIRMGSSLLEDTLVLVNVEPLTVPDLVEDGTGNEDLDIPFDDGVPGEDEDDEFAAASIDLDEAKELKKRRLIGPAGRPISDETFRILTQDGCAYCTGNINPDFPDKIGWLDTAHGGGVCCHECYDTYVDQGVFKVVH